MCSSFFFDIHSDQSVPLTKSSFISRSHSPSSVGKVQSPVLGFQFPCFLLVTHIHVPLCPYSFKLGFPSLRVFTKASWMGSNFSLICLLNLLIAVRCFSSSISVFNSYCTLPFGVPRVNMVCFPFFSNTSESAGELGNTFLPTIGLIVTLLRGLLYFFVFNNFLCPCNGSKNGGLFSDSSRRRLLLGTLLLGTPPRFFIRRLNLFRRCRCRRVLDMFIILIYILKS